ncbi:MAG: M48 family metalloprotease [Candidatus Heimdallarchaeota archaeon]|nr:M48 family metalloprotease [Candidatus Heimdallarchaeota archaeon]
MASYFQVQIRRIVSILLFLVYDLLQIYFVSHLVVKKSDNFIGYDFNWSPELTLTTTSVAFLIIMPFFLSYMTAVSNSTSGDGFVQVLGPNSLYKRVKDEFDLKNGGKKEFTVENAEFILEAMAVGEPRGSLDNLKTLLKIAMEARMLIDKSGVKSVRRVYINDLNIPNAFTLRVIPLPYLGQDWIIINSNVLDILEIEEIHAIVAHEIGHAARYDSWINSFLASPRLIIIFGWSIIFARMLGIMLQNNFNGFAINRIIALFALFAIIRFFLIFAQFLTYYTNRQAELLSDNYAGKLVGSEILVNALIKIGQRGEVINAIKLEIEWLQSKKRDLDVNLMIMNALTTLNPEERSLLKAREYALKLYITGTLSEMFNRFKISIPRENFQKMVKDATSNLLEERGDLVNQERVMLRLGEQRKQVFTTNLAEFDLDNNKRLDKIEIKALVEKIKLDDKSIFEFEALEKLGLVPETKSHPKVSERIIFLYDSVIAKEKTK